MSFSVHFPEQKEFFFQFFFLKKNISCLSLFYTGEEYLHNKFEIRCSNEGSKFSKRMSIFQYYSYICTSYQNVLLYCVKVISILDKLMYFFLILLNGTKQMNTILIV